MYARMVCFVVKPFRVKEFCDSVGVVAHDVAAKQSGFIEHVILVSEQEKRLVTVISLWQTKTEADHYQEELFPSVLSKLAPLIDAGPVLQYYTAVVSDSSAAGALSPYSPQDVRL